MISIGCRNSENKEPQLILKEYGKFELAKDSLSFELKLNQFKNFKQLLEKTEKAVCNDSFPKLVINKKDKTKIIYFQNPCWDHYACILIFQRNTIEIHNDTIIKQNQIFYPLDSLDNILKKDINNYGKDPFFSDKPEKLIIYISYDENGLERLPNTIDKLTDSYEKITSKLDIRIWLNERIEFIPPPPPPQQTQSIELIE